MVEQEATTLVNKGNVTLGKWHFFKKTSIFLALIIDNNSQ